MYSLHQLARGMKHPTLLFRELNRLYYTLLGTREVNPGGIDVFEEDWDNLLILDACRADMLSDGDLPGELSTVQSKATNTIGFLEANFSGKDLSDTVYVTANPQLAWNRERLDVQLHEVINVWEDEWADDMKTVLPETVTARAKEAAQEYPDKRLVVHYMQPHAPFLTDTSWDKDPESVSAWYDIIMGHTDVSREEAWDAFTATLEAALPHVEELMETLQGRTVVTADHGNFVGDRSFPLPVREWGHPRKIFHPALVEVPWLVYDNGDRRDIVRGSGADTGTVDEDEVKEKLEQLGYVT